MEEGQRRRLATREAEKLEKQRERERKRGGGRGGEEKEREKEGKRKKIGWGEAEKKARGRRRTEEVEKKGKDGRERGAKARILAEKLRGLHATDEFFGSIELLRLGDCSTLTLLLTQRFSNTDSKLVVWDQSHAQQ